MNGALGWMHLQLYTIVPPSPPDTSPPLVLHPEREEMLRRGHGPPKTDQRSYTHDGYTRPLCIEEGDKMRKHSLQKNTTRTLQNGMIAVESQTTLTSAAHSHFRISPPPSSLHSRLPHVSLPTLTHITSFQAQKILCHCQQPQEPPHL